MTALTITAANVAYVSGPIMRDQVAGEAFNAGALVAYDPTSQSWFKSECDSTTTLAGATNLAMALATAPAAGARVSLALPNAIVAVGTGTAGIVYHPGTTSGTLVPTADLVSTNKVTVAALGIGGNQLQIARVYNAGAVK